jgi:hypothetical protein
MAERRPGWEEPRLESALLDLGRHLAYPATPALAERVAASLEADREGQRLGPFGRFFGRPARRALVLAAIGLLVLAGAAVGLAIGLRGLPITFGTPPTPNVPDTPLGVRAALGEPISLEEARREASVEVLLPPGLGEPAEAYLEAAGTRLSLLWLANEQLPPIGGSRIGLMIQALAGRLEAQQMEKIVHESGADVRAVEVDGAPGYWISGAPHVFRWEVPGGGIGEERSRLVNDVLVWQEGTTVYRIESGLGFEETLRLAESLGPPD